MAKPDDVGFPRVYRTPKAEAFYEQCLWEGEHVEAIYPVLNGLLVADGSWREIPSHGGRVGRYRVYEGRYFQAVFASSPNRLFEALSGMDPVETEDDAEWAIWRLSSGEGYAMSSTFAITPGQFPHQPEVDRWLWRHGLGLDPNQRLVEGVAYFTALESDCMRDAMERLRWLENAFAELYVRLDAAGRAFWDEVKAESDAILARLGESLRPDEIVPLPERYPRRGWKRREPAGPD